MIVVKKAILTPNPYRDKNFQTVRNAMQILREAGIQTRLCLPFEIDNVYPISEEEYLKQVAASWK